MVFGIIGKYNFRKIKGKILKVKYKVIKIEMYLNFYFFCDIVIK